VNVPKWFYQQLYLENLRRAPYIAGVARYRFERKAGRLLTWLLIFGGFCGLVCYFWHAEHWNGGYTLGVILGGLLVLWVVVAGIADERYGYELSLDARHRTVTMWQRGLLGEKRRTFAVLQAAEPTAERVAYTTGSWGTRRVWGVFLSCTEGPVLLWAADREEDAREEAQRVSALLRAEG
jgi:hypothetical protein